MLSFLARLSALDLLKRDHMSLMDNSHDFSMQPDMTELVQRLYSCAAAALALLSEQVLRREDDWRGATAAERVLQVRWWRIMWCKPVLLHWW